MEIVCPNSSCRQPIAVEESWRGRSFQCPACGTLLALPTKPRTSKGTTKGTGINRNLLLWGGISFGCMLIAGTIAFTVLWKKHLREKAYEARRAAISKQQMNAPARSYDEVYIAAHDGDLARVKEALDAQPDLLNRHFGGFSSTLLNTASYNRHVEVVKELLRRKADVNGVTKDNKTALYDAVDGGNSGIVTLLLENG